ncbi:MAG TPA: enoyl-CoA hydratase/isomerase family protein [Mycobacterium sp.]
MPQHQWSSRRIRVEDAGDGVLIAYLGSDELGLFRREDGPEFFDLVERADRDPAVRAVVFTGTHPERFISHADLGWLQEDGAAIPPVGRRITNVVVKIGHQLNRHKFTRWIASKTPLTGAVQLDRVHATLTLISTSSTIFVAALNGTALGFGAEISWACDLRLMADGDYSIGHLEVLLGFPPGGGGTQRLPLLIGTHRALVAILEGRPFPAKEALEVGAIDEIVAPDQLLSRAVERARYLAARPTEAIGAIKRAVNAGTSLTMAKGLELEGTEFLALLPHAQAQEIMLRYVRETAENGELPLYQPDGYATALQNGAAVDITSRK